MTQSEYNRLYRKAQRATGRITAATKKELLKSFKEAADLAAEQVKITEAAGLSDLTSAAWRQIDNQLQAGADIISRATEQEIPLAISRAYSNYIDIDAEYVADAARQAGQILITDAGIKNIGIGVNFNLLQAQAARLFEDGRTFSERIWDLFDPDTGLPVGVNGDYQYRIKNLILTGNAQGRDVVKIAEDIQVYVAKGKNAVFREGRYGKLLPGTSEYRKRISRTIDWRALRLVRSEMNASLQEAGIVEGLVNPAALNLYDWIKTAGNPIDPDGSRNASGLRCIDLDRASPYPLEEVPGYQHPNCSCQVRPVLMDQRDFVKDLKTWVPGGSPEYLNQWYESFYLPANR